MMDSQSNNAMVSEPHLPDNVPNDQVEQIGQSVSRVNRDVKPSVLPVSSHFSQFTEQMISDSVMSQYHSIVSQRAQAAAAMMILGPSAAMNRESVSLTPTSPLPYYSNLAKAASPMITSHMTNTSANQMISSHMINTPTHMVSAASHMANVTNDMTNVADHMTNVANDMANVTNNMANVTDHMTSTTGAQMSVIANSSAAASGSQKPPERKSPARRRSAKDRVEKYKCDKCSYRSKWSHGLSNHMRTHNNTVFKCDVCDYSTPWKGDLKNHVRVHTGNMFTCTECDFTTYRKQGLEKHAILHTGAKPHKCPECNYSSSQPSNLKKHMMRHTGEKPISCDLCSYRCRQSSQLRQHVVQHHHVKHRTASLSSTKSAASQSRDSPAKKTSYRKRYHCIFCGYEWSSRQSYTQHMLSQHSADRPYKCGFVCCQSFNTREECDQHKNTHGASTNEDNYPVLTKDATTSTEDLPSNEKETGKASASYINQLQQPDQYSSQSAPANPFSDQSSSTNQYSNLSQLPNQYNIRPPAPSDFITQPDQSAEFVSHSGSPNKFVSQSDRPNEFVSQSDRPNEFVQQSQPSSEFVNQSDQSTGYIGQSNQPTDLLTQPEPLVPYTSQLNHSGIGHTNNQQTKTYDSQSMITLQSVGQSSLLTNVPRVDPCASAAMSTEHTLQPLTDILLHRQANDNDQSNTWGSPPAYSS